MQPPSLSELIEIGTPALLAEHGAHLTADQRRALTAMRDCQSGALGVTAMACSECGETHRCLRSCGHRSCPRCQHHAAEAWLARQRAKLLPVRYSMTTFTLPAALRPIAYRHPKLVYDALFAAAIATLKTFGMNHDGLRGEIGATAVLHTHTRRLDYHPHVHVIVPGCAIEPRRRQWRKLCGRYLFNGKALARVFRAKCLAALRAGELELPESLPRRWVVQCQRVGKGLPALKYLARYLYRGVITEQQIVGYDAERAEVTFRYRDGKTGEQRLRTLPLVEFLWRLMIHVLPKGFRRVRDYGLLHANAKRLRALIQLLLHVTLAPPPTTKRAFLCPGCGSLMHAILFWRARRAPP